ncbi:pantoate kinase [Methanimicrococcus blatticola]|uniref:Pantoate kinase n=1 Tax=Methanimicrococcus blatticola TaxID=91560 RepID=A0A484F2V7_9EURY|nr:pantoate kinase [Methanimicrococcus blatticola]MBZ3936088.1 pantothenate kinase [Methanimicrococcus blatticola]MCC2509303.1 pantothenate kinase [Methanimicrococcus blatticola]TDQ68190.1 pantothenate kinase [Methanimicrococcus blatticola]
MSEFETRTAFSPGHITGFFQIRNHSDPHTKGSVGAGLVLNKGIHSTVTPHSGNGETVVHLNGIKQSDSDDSTNAVLTVISEISALAEQKYKTPFHFEIKESSSLPVGSGFGLSAAGALSTAFAANSALHLGLSKNELVEIAHYAEVINGSGLGDVAGEAAGGLAVREVPGGSKHGKFYSVPLSKSDLQKKIYCLVLGELSTKSVITNEDSAKKINSAGTDALNNFLQKPDLNSFMNESLSFTKSIGLLSPDAEKIIDSIDKADGTAAQAMLGNTVFAIPSDREGAGEHIFELMQKFGDVYECRIETNGPHVCLSAF